MLAHDELVKINHELNDMACELDELQASKTKINLVTRVGVVGRLYSGKSSFINDYLGQAVSPTGVADRKEIIEVSRGKEEDNLSNRMLCSTIPTNLLIYDAPGFEHDCFTIQEQVDVMFFFIDGASVMDLALLEKFKLLKCPKKLLVLGKIDTIETETERLSIVTSLVWNLALIGCERTEIFMYSNKTVGPHPSMKLELFNQITYAMNFKRQHASNELSALCDVLAKRIDRNFAKDTANAISENRMALLTSRLVRSAVTIQAVGLAILGLTGKENDGVWKFQAVAGTLLTSLCLIAVVGLIRTVKYSRLTEERKLMLEGYKSRIVSLAERLLNE
jgi:GTPase Era involved in 16S rRNA processing